MCVFKWPCLLLDQGVWKQYKSGLDPTPTGPPGCTLPLDPKTDTWPISKTNLAHEGRVDFK